MVASEVRADARGVEAGAVSLPVCINCQKRRWCFLFEIAKTFDSDGEWSDALGRICVCYECAKDPIVQRTIVTSLIEETV